MWGGVGQELQSKELEPNRAKTFGDSWPAVDCANYDSITARTPPANHGLSLFLFHLSKGGAPIAANWPCCSQLGVSDPLPWGQVFEEWGPNGQRKDANLEERRGQPRTGSCVAVRSRFCSGSLELRPLMFCRLHVGRRVNEANIDVDLCLKL